MTDGRTRRIAVPAAGRRLDVLRILRSAEVPLSITTIANELGVHPNTVRFHLDVLVLQGRVERVAPDRKSPGRPPLLFRAVPGMDPTGPRDYRLLAEVLTESLAAGPDPAERSIEAGRVWGHHLARSAVPVPAGSPEPTERLVALLDGLGFAPERREVAGRSQIGLRNCPFLDLVETRSEVICPVHLGLMQGALDAWGAPVTVGRLEPFAEPDLCLAHLAAGSAAR
jgi:predicted ArsR family transcriptional regulator